MKRTHFFILIFSLLVVLTIFLDYKDTDFTFHDILVEFHGLIFDLFFLGIILTLYENYRDKKDKKERYKEEIDDFRNWQSEEAKYKILGNIRRLYDLGSTEFILNHCYIKNGDLTEFNFTNSSFAFANLESACFSKSNLNNCTFVGADLRKILCVETMANNANFERGDLSNSTFTNCDLSSSNLRSANLKYAKICGTDFNNADMRIANLNKIKTYDENWLETLRLNNVKGIEKLSEKFEIRPESIDRDEIGEFWTVTKKTNTQYQL